MASRVAGSASPKPTAKRVIPASVIILACGRVAGGSADEATSNFNEAVCGVRVARSTSTNLDSCTTLGQEGADCTHWRLWGLRAVPITCAMAVWSPCPVVWTPSVRSSIVLSALLRPLVCMISCPNRSPSEIDVFPLAGAALEIASAIAW